ncbi:MULTISPECIES: hypothetical protein [Providencia]|uniref:Uncharacterized protein n=1 Tax=Providencia huaxiensis TaxID=2027290 RepID=A0ABU2J1A7_9GAMM|nr:MULTISPECIES: hypothetical protein [Providencia]MBZ3679882.1 hypothetical protein [Providencia rettgeri]AXH63988.1 hypothetical protein CYG50_19305 [Providencia huaxiensis]MCD2530108.1 hypothetical protein [Providencia huaxiensis]MDT0135109.1 hypothetical protein [Providencia huaxiensis]MDT1981514.1 hypothetical protein [Providencia huaxiensis]
MNEKRIERIVQQVLRQLKRQVLVVLSPVEGYQQAIYQRLAQLDSVSFSFYATASMLQSADVEKWAELGSVVNKSTLSISRLSHYDSLFLPFIDAKVVGEIANGLFVSEESELALHALSQNMSILALKYHCCPESELSQVLGLNKNENYNRLIKENISKAINLGIHFGSLNEVEKKFIVNEITEELKPEINNEHPNRYITLKEVMNNPRGYCANENKLTDSAIDYLKSLKK